MEGKKTWHTWEEEEEEKKKENLSCSGKKTNKQTNKNKNKKTCPHIEEGKKLHAWDLLFRREGEATLKRRVSFWSVTMTLSSKVQPAGGCFELQSLYGACRVFIKISGYISEKGGCFAQNGEWATPTHPPLPHTNSSLASCILMQLSDLCLTNKLFRVHCTCTTRYHQKRTCWRHARYWEGVGWGCIAPPKFPNLQKKSRKLVFARQASLKNWKFYIYLDRKIDQISGKGPLLSDLHPLRPKNSRNFGKMPTFINSGRDSTFEKFASSSENEILGMGLVEAMQSNA